MVSEARLRRTEEGLVPEGQGWWVLNARDARWIERDGRGWNVPFTGWTGDEVEGFYDLLGVNLIVLQPGQPGSVYHRERDQEGFLVVAGEAILLVEGQERPLRQWDYVHCPVDCQHTIIGAGEGNCVIVAAGSRVNVGSDDWGAYTVDPVAQRYGAAPDEETTSAGAAYSRWKPSKPVRYGGWLSEER